MAKRPEDRYANLASARVTLSAANTLTFVELATGISLGQGTGILIDQIDYQINTAALLEMTTAGDSITVGWSTSDAVTAPTLNERRVLHMSTIERHDFGSAASAQFLKKPDSYQFFPPIIVAAPRLYFFMNTDGLANIAAAFSRFNFRYIPLTDKEYLELAETFILVG